MMRRFIVLLIAIFFLPLTATAQSRWQPELRVGLFSAATVTLKFSEPIAVGDLKIEVDEPIAISIVDGKISIGKKIIDGSELELRPKDDAMIREMITTIDGKKYPGTVKLVLKNNQLVVINLTTADEYLRGVIPGEMPTSWHLEALKAQTIAARTFALKNRRRHAADGYDLCSTTHCQVYKDLSAAVESSDAAIEATFGEVLMYNGALINATFHSDSGGMTEDAAEVWGQAVPYLIAVEDFDTKTYPWNKKIAVKDFVAALGSDIGTLKAIKLSALEIGRGAADRSSSGRVKFLIAVGSKGEVKITGVEMRTKFKLQSTLFDAKLNGDAVEINGYGFGHGVGMAQYGAKDYADNGVGSADIVTHYYKGAAIKKAYGFLPPWTKKN